LAGTVLATAWLGGALFKNKLGADEKLGVRSLELGGVVKDLAQAKGDIKANKRRGNKGQRCFFT
jgi:hypothetical protein